MKIGIHIFRKDLRVIDNLALNELANHVDKVIGVFVLDPKQIKQNKHYSPHAAQFLLDSVADLDQQLKGNLLILEGNPITLIEDLVRAANADMLSFNSDFTPYATQRDQAIIKRLDIEVITSNDDQTLIEMNKLLKRDGTPYMTYSSFMKQELTNTIPATKSKRIAWYRPRSFKKIKLPIIKSDRTWPGGRTEALRRLASNNFDRDDDVEAESSHISAYLNCGCVSIREVYWKLKQRYRASAPIRTLLWRDFLLSIYRFCPDANQHDTFIDDRYSKIRWPTLSKTDWKRFDNCSTGFLLIDAAMAELKKTGFINNRARLLLATFWIKYLLVSPLDREYGSQISFSKLLIDCSASQNKLNHLWVLGDLDFAGRRFGKKGAHPLTGRMIRIDNDMIKRYDPRYEYISKWIPAFANKTLKEQKQLMKQTKPMYEWRARYDQYTALFKAIPKATT